MADPEGGIRDLETRFQETGDGNKIVMEGEETTDLGMEAVPGDVVGGQPFKGKNTEESPLGEGKYDTGDSCELRNDLLETKVDIMETKYGIDDTPSESRDNLVDVPLKSDDLIEDLPLKDKDEDVGRETDHIRKDVTEIETLEEETVSEEDKDGLDDEPAETMESIGCETTMDNGNSMENVPMSDESGDTVADGEKMLPTEAPQSSCSDTSDADQSVLVSVDGTIENRLEQTEIPEDVAQMDGLKDQEVPGTESMNDLETEGGEMMVGSDEDDPEGSVTMNEIGNELEGSVKMDEMVVAEAAPPSDVEEEAVVPVFISRKGHLEAVSSRLETRYGQVSKDAGDGYVSDNEAPISAGLEAVASDNVYPESQMPRPLEDTIDLEAEPAEFPVDTEEQEFLELEALCSAGANEQEMEEQVLGRSLEAEFGDSPEGLVSGVEPDMYEQEAPDERPQQELFDDDYYDDHIGDYSLDEEEEEEWELLYDSEADLILGVDSADTSLEEQGGTAMPMDLLKLIEDVTSSEEVEAVQEEEVMPISVSKGGGLETIFDKLHRRHDSEELESCPEPVTEEIAEEGVCVAMSANIRRNQSEDDIPVFLTEQEVADIMQGKVERPSLQSPSLEPPQREYF